MGGGTWEGREAQGSPPSPFPDMTTPLGLSRQHLSYLQEIGNGWFGKVSGAGLGGGGPYRPGLCSCSMFIPTSALTTSHLSLDPNPALSAHHTPHQCPPATSPCICPVSASLLTPLTTPPRHPALHTSVRLSILPSVPASIGLWARESLTHVWWGMDKGGWA